MIAFLPTLRAGGRVVNMEDEMELKPLLTWMPLAQPLIGLVLFGMAILMPPWQAHAQWVRRTAHLAWDPEHLLTRPPQYDFLTAPLPGAPPPMLATASLAGVTSAERSLEAERIDLTWALREQGAMEGSISNVLKSHTSERGLVLELNHRGWKTNQVPVVPNAQTPLPLEWPQPVEGLPAEFDEYFRGFVWWHAGFPAQARIHWERLLEFPPAERYYKSVWAAYMIGRSWEASDEGRSADAYQQSRDLVREGYSDRLGLAEAGLGREARLHYQARRYEKAIEIYLQQWARGDPSARNSLLFTCSAALHQRPGVYKALLQHPPSREVMTDFMMARGWRRYPLDIDHPVVETILEVMGKVTWMRSGIRGLHTRRRPVEMWVNAVGDSGATNSAFAEKMAFIHYRGDLWEEAARWIQRAGDRPLARWLQAKLFLKENRIEEAFVLLDGLIGEVPCRPQGEAAGPDTLIHHTYRDGGYRARFTAGEAILGEWGTLQIIRGQYEAGLEALLRTRYWSDAAYVAECVLTVDELKAFVDRHRSRDASEWAEHPLGYYDGEHSFAHLSKLLARRLAREDRLDEALPYFPEYLRKQPLQYRNLLAAASDPAQSDAERAAHYWEAAKMARKGYDFLAFETDTSWRPVGWMDRRTDELNRVERHTTLLGGNRNYFFTAAELGWKAAGLLPDQESETARVLCLAGTWVKYADAEFADRFYKALVRRCRNTELGDWADEMRWFPKMDIEGNLLVRRSPEAEQPLPNP